MTDATVICPICKSTVKPLDRTNDADGFDCPRHGKLKVSGTATGTKGGATSEQWEDALKKAKARTAAGGWPLIKDADF